MQRNYNKLVLNVWCACILALVLPSLVSALQSCLTPTNADGYCIPIKECSWFTRKAEQFGQRGYPNAFINYVRKSQCFVNNESGPHICCDSEFVKQTTSTTTTTTTTTTLRPSFKSLSDYMSSLNSRGVEILNTTRCGFIGGNRVAHGVDTKLFEFPWMALLRYDTLGNQFQCGGSLITTKYVLTAAHCVDTFLELIGVRLGEWDLTTDPDSQLRGSRVLTAPPVEDFEIARTVVHPGYNKYQMINDVALVKLKSVVTFNRHIQPICLPIMQQSIAQPQTEYFIAGWGTTENGTTSNILQKAKVTHQPLQVCQDIFKSNSVNEETICAGGTSNIDSCKGDSGGPLFFTAPYRLAQRYVQFGIVSFGGIKCGADRAYPGIYASVVQFMPWITSKLD